MHRKTNKRVSRTKRRSRTNKKMGGGYWTFETATGSDSIKTVTIKYAARLGTWALSKSEDHKYWSATTKTLKIGDILIKKNATWPDTGIVVVESFNIATNQKVTSIFLRKLYYFANTEKAQKIYSSLYEEIKPDKAENLETESEKTPVQSDPKVDEIKRIFANTTFSGAVLLTAKSSCTKNSINDCQMGIHSTKKGFFSKGKIDANVGVETINPGNFGNYINYKHLSTSGTTDFDAISTIVHNKQEKVFKCYIIFRKLYYYTKDLGMEMTKAQDKLTESEKTFLKGLDATSMAATTSNQPETESGTIVENTDAHEREKSELKIKMENEFKNPGDLSQKNRSPRQIVPIGSTRKIRFIPHRQPHPQYLRRFQRPKL